MKLDYLEKHFLKDPYFGFSILSRSRISGLNINHASVIYKRLYKPFARSLISTQSTLMQPDWPVFDINVVSWYQQDVIVHFEEDTQHIRPICSWICDTVVVSQDFTAKCIVLLSLLLEVVWMEFTSQKSIPMGSSLFPWVHNGIKVRFCLVHSVCCKITYLSPKCALCW